MKKYILYLSTIVFVAGGLNYLSGCAVSEKVSSKSGVQLWGENCIRCHNAPPATRYSDDDWAVIVTHMRTFNALTASEEVKIREYLQASN